MTIAVWFLVGTVIFSVGWTFLARPAWRRFAREERATVPTCSCGYALLDLDRARCPECGRVFGFDASAEELDLTEDELHRIALRRRERME